MQKGPHSEEVTSCPQTRVNSTALLHDSNDNNESIDNVPDLRRVRPPKRK